jgi:hypothetical protein
LNRGWQNEVRSGCVDLTLNDDKPFA